MGGFFFYRPADGPTSLPSPSPTHSLQSKEVRICLVGKYTGLEDAYASVVKALQHSCLVAGRRLAVDWVEASDLEAATQDANPVQFHAAWSKVRAHF